MKKPTRKTEATPRLKAKGATGPGYGTNPRKRTRTEDDAAPRARRSAAPGAGSPRRSRTEDDAAPRAKRSYASGTGAPRRSRTTEDGSAPRAKRPAASGYGTNPKRRTRPEEDTPTFRKPKAVTDGGERPATRRRISAAGSDESRPRRKRTADENSTAPRRSFTSRFGNDEPKPYARPRRTTGDADREERPAGRGRFGSEDKPRFQKPGTGAPTRRFESKFKKRDDDTGTSRPARRTTERFGDADEKRPRRSTPFGSENTSRFAPKGKDDVKKNFRNKPVRTPDYDFSEVEGKAKAKSKRTREEKDDTVRLNRYIANAGVCSRRDADVLIQSGDIKVNGNVVTEMGYQVKPGDIVKYGNRVLNREKMVYVLLNKPKDFITTTEDPEERRTVMDLVKEAADTRLFPVGRLDRNTTGLLLLTNDGELSEKLTHPSHNIKKIYEVHLDKPISEEDFHRVLEGVELEDGKAEVDELATVTPDRTVLGIELHLGRNRIVRRIFEHLGYDVIKLDRVMYAGLDKKDLPRGKWRYLSEKEVIRLKYFL